MTNREDRDEVSGPAAEAPGGDDDPAGRVAPFEVLLAVQDLDTATAQLQHRKLALPARAELAAVHQQLAGARAQEAEARDRRQALMDRQAQIEAQVAALSSRRKAVEDRLYSARGSAARDLQAMNEEVQHLGQRRAELEEVELEVMEEQEPIDTELVALGAAVAALEATSAEVGAVVAAADTEIDGELAALAAARLGEAARLPADLAARYETLRTRLRGVGAARLVGNRCEGCHLELPSVEVERIRRLPPDTLVTCDHCGRILVRA